MKPVEPRNKDVRMLRYSPSRTRAMFEIQTIPQTGANRLPNDVPRPQNILAASQLEFGRSEEAQTGKPAENQPARSDIPQPEKTGSTLLWSVLGAFFVALICGYPLLLARRGDFHAIRFLLQLGVSLLLLALVLGALFLLTAREQEKR